MTTTLLGLSAAVLVAHNMWHFQHHSSNYTYVKTKYYKRNRYRYITCIILENLATDSLGEPSELSGYVDCEIGLIDDFRIIDVRVLPEFDPPSSPSEYKLDIMRVTSYLELG